MHATPACWQRPRPKTVSPMKTASPAGAPTWERAASTRRGGRGLLDSASPENVEADRGAGRHVRPPLLALWSKRDDLEDPYGDPLPVWRLWADNVNEPSRSAGHRQRATSHGRRRPGRLCAAWFRTLLSLSSWLFLFVTRGSRHPAGRAG